MVLGNRDFKQGDRVVVVRVCSHGDWKTATLHPEKWQTLNQGREGIFKSWFSNLYGDFARVDFDGVIYDIEPINILRADSKDKEGQFFLNIATTGNLPLNVIVDHL